jgi:hypothetical protein
MIIKTFASYGKDIYFRNCSDVKDWNICMSIVINLTLEEFNYVYAAYEK